MQSPEYERVNSNLRQYTPYQGANNFIGRRKLLRYVFYFIGAGGVAIFSVKLRESWNSIHRTVPTQKPAKVTPEPEQTESPAARTTPDQKTAKEPPKPKKTESPAPPKNTIPALLEDSFSFETVKVSEQGEVIRRESKATTMWIEDLGKGIKLEMVKVPFGTFTMGSPAYEKGRQKNEEPQRKVTIQPFLMGRFPVTQALWKYVSKLPRVEIDLPSDPSYFKGNLRPVERISWYEAREFCARLSKATNREYRLPSESEWEYACRAGTTTPFYFGKSITTKLANYDGSYVYGRELKGIYRERTTEVGTFPPNNYGLFDMHGNLWEWCADHFHENYKRAPKNESAWFSNNENARRVIRGGSWFNAPKRCRSANRSPLSPDNRGVSEGRDSSNVGFRIVCVVKESVYS
ncbi:MAG: SUMF1/EgtB/PvdO family nonheme iron enzyme [Rivularia sp. (in: cyanobacteria)]